MYISLENTSMVEKFLLFVVITEYFGWLQSGLPFRLISKICAYVQGQSISQKKRMHLFLRNVLILRCLFFRYGNKTETEKSIVQFYF